MKVQTNAVRQDLLRGIRWGAILLIAALLTIAAYRVISSSPAVASQPVSQPVEEALAPEPSVTVEPETAIQVGDAVVKKQDVRSEPALPVRRKPAAKVTAPVIPPSQRFSAPARTPVPVAVAAPRANAFVSEALPEVQSAPSPGIEMPGPGTAASLSPPPEDSKQGNRATRIVRSVGRIFRLGRKDSQPATK